MVEPESEAPPSEQHTIIPALCAWVFAVLIVATSIAERALPMTPPVRVLFAVTLCWGLVTLLAYTIRWFKARPAIAYPTLFLIALFIAWAGFAGKPHDKEYAGMTYVRRALLHVNTRYQAHGETTYGMDEAGLARACLYQTMFYEGIREMNPRLLGGALVRFWWRDLSLEDMLRGAYGYTNPVGAAKKLAGYTPRYLQKGDLAILRDHRRLLIYAGGSNWVQADRQTGKVVMLSARADPPLPEFTTPAVIVRWWLLDQR